MADPTPSQQLDALAKEAQALATTLGTLIDGLTDHAAAAQLVRGKLLSIATDAKRLAPLYPGAKP